MSKFKQWRRKIGLFYWKCNGKMKTWWYNQKKSVKCFLVWVKGWKHPRKQDFVAMENAKCLIVCAHPDDETIFFSSIIKKEKPYVICASHRGNLVRAEEFRQALAYWGVEGILLNAPDVPGFTWLWKRVVEGDLKKLRKICPDVSTVYTHSGCGESKHPHHFAVHDAVTRVCSDCKIYTTAAFIPPDQANSLDEECIREKYEVVKTIYGSQIDMLETWCWWWNTYLNNECFEE
jgi:LmbE family N-acetylglucosaminyl deacetylase